MPVDFRPFIAIFALLILFSCNGKKQQPAFYDTGEIQTDSMVVAMPNTDLSQGDNNTLTVPFKDQDGVKYIKVTINGCLGVEMIFDTGCSGTLISVAEAKYLYQKGYLTRDDYMGDSHSQIADGSIVDDMVFNIKDVAIDDKLHCENVTATVSSNVNAPLLLGNEVLNRVASYTIDNEQQVINFKLK